MPAIGTPFTLRRIRSLSRAHTAGAPPAPSARGVWHRTCESRRAMMRSLVVTERSPLLPFSAPSNLSDATWSAALLSGVAGYVDAAGYLAIFGLFTAHLTGQLAAMSAAATDGGDRAAAGRL